MSAAQHSSLIPLYRLLFTSTLLALAAVFAYAILPEQATPVLPDPGTETHLFFDQQNGGTTRAEWVDKARYSFKCIAAATSIATPYCGMNIHFGQAHSNKDFLHYQRMELKIHYRGDTQRLRLKMYSFRPAQLNEKYRETMTGQEFSILSSETHNLITINNYGVDINPRSVANAAQGTASTAYNTFDISMDLVPPIAPGEQFIQLESITIYNALLPADTWYLAVAVLWLASNLLFIVRHLILQERRIRNDTQRLTSLAHYSEDLIQESEHYKMLSHTDALTHALNRHGFATEMSVRSPTGKVAPNTTLLIIDLDHFKNINDSWGHDTGDVVLCETAQTIRKMTRTDDRLVRWGGEEFLLYCDNSNTQQALLIAEKIRAAIAAQPMQFNGNSIRVTVSIGVGVTTKEEDFDYLFKRSDQALYKAKSLGRNCIVLSDA
jgi:diguanylate cyclase (GGDEF)-like protein